MCHLAPTLAFSFPSFPLHSPLFNRIACDQPSPLSQVKSAIRSLDLPSRARQLQLTTPIAITPAKLQVSQFTHRNPKAAVILRPVWPHAHPLHISLHPLRPQEMEEENSRLEAEVERMQAALAADKSLANAAHKVRISLPPNPKPQSSWVAGP